MKVVLFCGGLGTRLREHSDTIPKPLVEVGNRPIIWHLMKSYAHYGHTTFILCLGYRGDAIKDYFLNYNPYTTDDFVFEAGQANLSDPENDITEWKITFVDTGLHANLGERLLAVRKHVENEEIFLANYSDQLSDVDINSNIKRLRESGAIGCATAVRPPHSFHSITAGNDDFVTGITPVTDTDMWLNGGYFVFRKELFDYIEPGEELVVEPFHRLIEKRNLIALKHEGFWKAMDTFKDKIEFERMYARGQRPWEHWQNKNDSG